MRKFKSLDDIPVNLSDNPKMYVGSNPTYKYLVFEDEQEFQTYIATNFSQWSKDSHIARINQLHDTEFENLLQSRNYLSMSELSLWAQSADGEYYEEANALLLWYTSTYRTIEVYAESVTEQTAIDPEVFIGNLPVFSFGE